MSPWNGHGMRRNSNVYVFTAITGITILLLTSKLIPDFGCQTVTQYPVVSIQHSKTEVDLFGGMPHVDSCNRCQTCYVPIYREDSNDWFRRRSRRLLGTTVRREAQLAPVYDKSHYPNCTECWGCRQSIHRMSRYVSGFNLDGYETVRGQSDGHVYSIKDPNINDAEFVVKLWCVESSTNPKKKKKSSACDDDEMITSLQIALGVQRIVDECQFRDVVSNVWVAPINAVLPRTGYHVNMDGLWAEKARGVPMDAFIEDSLDNGMDSAVFEDIVNNKLNSSEIVMAAVLDLLTCQGDRHMQNVYISESGHITLIDNEEALGHAWRPVGVDSIFIPSTQFHSIQHIGNGYIRKKTDTPRAHPVASVVLDYRCHVPNDHIGADYPPEAKKVMQRIMKMSIEAVKEHYTLPDDETAQRLMQRARDMMNEGFEWTIENGDPMNVKSLKYPWHPPCCKIRVVNGTSDVECADSLYKRDFTRPIGDAKFGDY